MEVYIVTNLSTSLKNSFAPYKDKVKVFTDKEKAIAQFWEWCGDDPMMRAMGVDPKVGKKISSSEAAEILTLKVTE